MFYTVMSHLKDVIEGEMAPGGRLEGIKSVALGDIKVAASDNYPMVSIIFDSSGIKGTKSKIEFEMNFSINLCTIGSSLEESAVIMEQLFWDDSEPSKKGLIPVLISNSGFTSGDNTFRLEIGEWEIDTGDKKTDRFTTRAKIPVTVRIWKNLM